MHFPNCSAVSELNWWTRKVNRLFQQQNTKLNVLNRRRTISRKRSAATAVEFALACPLILLLVFGLLEISRVMTVSDSMKTSVIAGAREAGIAHTTADNVKEKMAAVLDLFEVDSRDIVVTPEIIDATVDQVSIDIQVPLNSANGLFFLKLVSSEKMEFSTVLQRN